jgi:hypothetical protein
LSKISADPSTKVIVISCLSTIVNKLGRAPDAKVGIEHAMILVGNIWHEIFKAKRGLVQILVAPFNPRNSQDYSAAISYAMV